MKNFVRGVALSIVCALPVIWLASVLFEFSSQDWYSVSWGGFLALTYVSAGFVSFYVALSKENKSFGRMVIVSIAGRLFLIAAAIIVVFKFADVNKAVFLITLFVFYFIFQVWELVSFNKLVVKGS